MDIKNLSKIDLGQIIKNKNLLANIGIILLALIITRNMHIGQVQEINQLKESLNKENEITVFIDDLKALEDEIDELQGDFEINLTSDKVMEKISILAKKNTLRISSIDAQSTVDKKTYQFIPITLRITSDYHKLGHFINDIEKTGILKIKSLRIDNRQTNYSKTLAENEASLELIAISLKKK